VPGLKLRPSPDIAAVQWGKLLVNLNNALNALADLPLRRQLAQRAWRGLFADAWPRSGRRASSQCRRRRSRQA
jgi:2-dehydropantoate 2-reductase